MVPRFEQLNLLPKPLKQSPCQRVSNLPLTIVTSIGNNYIAQLKSHKKQYHCQILLVGVFKRMTSQWQGKEDVDVHNNGNS